MRRLAAALALLAAACGGAGGAACDPALDAWGEAGFAGAVAIAGPDGTCLAGFGDADRLAGRPNTPDTVFSIGSVTKTFTAAAVHQLAAAGRLVLDDPAGRWLDDLPEPVASVTIRQLLTHTSGLAASHGRDYVPLDRDAAISAIGGLDLAFAPGSDHLYSNAGYTLLAAIVEEAAGTGFRTYVTSEILTLPDGTTLGGFWDGDPAPDGPRAVGYLPDGATGELGDFAGPHWAIEGNGGLAMSVEELATWVRAYFSGQIVPAAAMAEMTAPAFELGGGAAEASGWIALDDSRFGAPAFANSGGGGSVGHDVTIVWLPRTQVAVVAASNQQDLSAGQLLQAILPALAAGEPLPQPAATGTADPAVLAAVAGTYDAGGGATFTATADDGALLVEATGPAAVAALFPLPAGADAAGHEALVARFLGGETSDGRRELDVLEAEFGELEDVTIDGTIFAGFELRTYVTLDFARAGAVPAWYAANAAGELAGASVMPAPPARRFGPAGDGEWAALDSAAGPTLTIDGDVLVVGDLTATRR